MAVIAYDVPAIDPVTGKIYPEFLPSTTVDAASLAATLAGTPVELRAVNGVYPGRPNTERPVWWMSTDVLPPAPGSTSSGTGPVVDLDSVFLSPGLAAPV